MYSFRIFTKYEMQYPYNFMPLLSLIDISAQTPRQPGLTEGLWFQVQDTP